MCTWPLVFHTDGCAHRPGLHLSHISICSAHQMYLGRSQSVTVTVHRCSTANLSVCSYHSAVPDHINANVEVLKTHTDTTCKNKHPDLHHATTQCQLAIIIHTTSHAHPRKMFERDNVVQNLPFPKDYFLRPFPWSVHMALCRCWAVGGCGLH